MTGKGY